MCFLFLFLVVLSQSYKTQGNKSKEIEIFSRSVVVFATTFNQRLSKCLPGFLLLHNQLLIINSNQ